MSWTIKWTKTAKKHLEKYSENLKEKIDSAIISMVRYYDGENEPKPDVKLLKGKYKGLLRLRVGDYRIIFSMDYKVKEIFIIEVLPRGDAYKGWIKKLQKTS